MASFLFITPKSVTEYNYAKKKKKIVLQNICCVLYEDKLIFVDEQFLCPAI